MAFGVGVITLVPDLWRAMLAPQAGLVGRAFAHGLAQLHLHDLRSFGTGPHRNVDDAPFGGGAGMILSVEPLHRAIDAARQSTDGPVLLLTPRGPSLKQATAQQLAAGNGLSLICGRYEGVDERVRHFVDAEVSLGDFILSAGDPAGFALVDAVVRLLPGVLGNPQSLQEESFSHGLLEYPHYTRPAVYHGMEVPPVLRSGDHAAVAQWRQQQAVWNTQAYRPDLGSERK